MPPTIIRPSSGSEGEGDDDASAVQYKRASRLNVLGGAEHQEAPRLSKSFSFYDPDILKLMESISRFESSDELSLDLPTSKGHLSEKSPLTELKENKQELSEEDTVVDQEREQSSSSPEMKKNDSTSSLNKISNKMRQSIKQARNGHISMDTDFVESILQDLDATREKMKTLQRKYDRIRRASQQAAQGFSSARDEYEQEVQARYDAESEMLSLKRQLHLQATKLTEMTTVRKQQEKLQGKSHLVKDSIQSMERDLTKLTVERDLTVAEVAELIALQDGRNLPLNGNKESIKRSLALRLEGVKDRYRQELNDTLAERDALLIEIEELRQSRDVYAEETQALNSRNEELNATLALLNRRVEHAQIGSSSVGHRANQQHTPLPGIPGRPNAAQVGGASAFGFGFGKQSRQTSGAHSNSTSTTAVDSIGSSLNSHSVLPVEHGGTIARVAPVPVTKAEAVPKKFKWKKTTKLTAETARNAGQQLANGLQGVINPSPPVPPKAPSQQSSPYAHNTAPSLQQQQQQQQQHLQQQQHPQQTQQHPQHHHQNSSSQHQSNSSDQTLSPSGYSNGTSTNGEVVVKEHLFQPFSVLRPMRCFACQKNMWGQSEMKCSLCNQVCHVRCLQSLPTSCNQPFTRSDEVSDYNGPSMFGRSLAEQVQSEGPDRITPLVVEKCIQAVEKMGMDYEGIYRKSGGTSQLKIITQLFENRQPFNLENSDRFNDISAVTSVLKNYFRELPEPLLTYELHEKFIDCAETKQDLAKKESGMKELVQLLPKEHFDTLKVLILHLHRVQGKAEENRMNSRNLGVVFGREWAHERKND